MTENKYQLGKIYKLTSEHTNKIYIGSTCEKLLSRRLSKHNTGYNGWKNGTYTYTTSFVLFELGLVQITLLEDYPCNTKEELISRERHWIELHLDILVNKNIPTRKSLEYRQINKEKINQRSKEYQKANYEANKDKISEQRKQYYEANKDKIKEQKRQSYLANKNKKCLKKTI
jgi:hypothetical protein